MALNGGWPAQMRKMLKEKPPRGGEPWTNEEHQMLIAGYRAGLTPIDLAAKHERTPAACVSRLCWLNVLVAHEGAYYELPREPYVTVRQMMNAAKA